MTRRRSRNDAVCASALVLVVALLSCSESGNSSAEQSFLVVVEEAIAPQLQDELEQYVETLSAEQVAVGETRTTTAFTTLTPISS